MRRAAGWVAWGLLALLAIACMNPGRVVDSLQFTTRPPRTEDVVGTWVPKHGEALAEVWGVVGRVPLSVELEEDGLGRTCGLALLEPSGERRETALAWLRDGAGGFPVELCSWKVVAVPGGYQNVELVGGPEGTPPVRLEMWGLGPPYELSTFYDDADPDLGHYLVLVREGDPPRGTAKAASAPPAEPAASSAETDDPPFGTLGRLAIYGAMLLAVALAVLAALLALALVVFLLVVACAAVAALAAGTALGVTAASVVVGVARRSASAGFRTFAGLVGALGGAPLGLLAAALLRGVVFPSWSLAGTLVAGAAGGAFAGAGAGYLLARMAGLALSTLRARPPATAVSVS